MGTLMRAALVTTFIFVTGIIFGLWIGTERVSELDQTMLELEENVKSAELQFIFFETMGIEHSCDYLDRQRWSIGEETEELGKEVERFEDSMKLDDASFYELKERYTHSLLKSWLTVERIKNDCPADFVTVLYFYSNEECDGCEEQGIILSHYKEQLDTDLLIYSIDTDLNLEIVQMLEDVYGVEQYPTLIINREIHRGFMDASELKETLCEENPNLKVC